MIVFSTRKTYLIDNTARIGEELGRKGTRERSSGRLELRGSP